jgi:heptosyltransferase-2/heptosyltransferase-3
LYCAGGGIGDSLVASIVARALHARYELVEALTLPAHAAALGRVPDIDDVLVDEDQDEGHLARTLRERRYDAAIVTWATPRTARVPQLAQIPVRVGQARRLYSWRFTHRVVVRSERGDVSSHWSQILLDYARVLQCDTSDVIPRVETTAEDRDEAQGLLETLELSQRRFAIVHTTNAIAPKRGIWPIGGWTRLVDAIRREFDVAVVLSGTQVDRDIVEQIAQESGGVPIAGRTSIGGFAALAQRAQVFAGITTGSMHVAAAVGTPTVGIFPFQTDTPERWAPLGLRTAIVRASYPCRPGERKETCPDYACVANLDVPRIVSAARSLLTSHGEARCSG